ncbi:MAG: hypothetical protein RLP02_12535, partial [Coleofasciculus sp. C2-GNP5-27]
LINCLTASNFSRERSKTMIFRKRPVPHPMILEDSWPVRQRPSIWRRLLVILVLGVFCYVGINLIYM